MPDGLGERKFTFAVVTDTHVNFGETECNSEFEINKRANGRMRHVVRDLNRRDLAFVVHLGDLVHPVPALPDLYERAAARFKEQVADLRHPLYVVPGNHDIGDKPIVWGPGGVVCDEFIALWKETFGPNYQAFDHGNCRFFLIDAQIINSGLAAEVEQRSWLEAELATASDGGKRVFFNTHYPPFLTDADEDEHFDNIAEPGRSWLLDLMARHEVEAVFSGHVHNIWYNRYGVTDFYALPSTAFVRQDYSEIYRATPPPETEGGRSDLAKLGYFIVHVHEGGHLCEWMRTYGAVAEPESSDAAPAHRVATIHPLQNPNTRFGFDMRQNWLEVVEIPPSGSLDEFDRKRTRNDYALMALMEMAVRRVRIPASDLLDPAHRARLDACARQGFRFTLFSFGVPDSCLIDTVNNTRGLVDTWEIGHVMDEMPAVAAAVANADGVSLYFSKIRSKEDIEQSGETYHHLISHGFTPDDAEHIARAAAVDGIDGIVFRVDGNTSPWRAARDAEGMCRTNGLKASLHIRMTIGNPGAVQADEAWVANRAAEALAAAAAHANIHVYSDTFADVDRGYYRRQGVVDRFYNPRPAFHVLRHLNAALAGGFGTQTEGAFTPGRDDIPITFVDQNDRRYCLVSGKIPSAISDLGETGQVLDLLSGEHVNAEQVSERVSSSKHPPHLFLWMSGD